MMFYTRSKRKISVLIATILLAFLSGCSVNLQQGNLENIPLTQEKFSFFGNIPFVYGGDSLELSQDLLRAYTAAATPEDYPRNSCRGNAEIIASVKQESAPSSWTLGAVIIPFWPILPVDETLSLPSAPAFSAMALWSSTLNFRNRNRSRPPYTAACEAT